MMQQYQVIYYAMRVIGKLTLHTDWKTSASNRAFVSAFILPFITDDMIEKASDYHLPAVEHILRRIVLILKAHFKLHHIAPSDAFPILRWIILSKGKRVKSPMTSKESRRRIRTRLQLYLTKYNNSQKRRPNIYFLACFVLRQLHIPFPTLTHIVALKCKQQRINQIFMTDNVTREILEQVN